MKNALEEVYHQYNRAEHRNSDPVEFVWQQKTLLDQEGIGLVCALLAYGNVKIVRRSIGSVLSAIGTNEPSVSAWALEMSLNKTKVPYEFQSFKHRFNPGTDVFVLLMWWASVVREFGSLGGLFLQEFKNVSDLTLALERVLDKLEEFVAQAGYPKGRTDYFITKPSRGGACKRWYMYLKWMIRRDEIDPGTWRSMGIQIPTSKLLMPLDTHTARISQYLGFNDKESAKHSDVIAVTAKFSEVEPHDPTKYDFALSRLGILKLCERKFESKICPQCPLLSVCQFAREYVVA